MADLRPNRTSPLPLSVRRTHSFWPQPDHEAVLQAALLQPPRLQDALDRWCRGSSLERVDYPTLSVLPLLYRNLCRHDLGRDLCAQLRGVYRWSWHRNQLLLAAVGEALTVLAEAGIDVVLMKGVPLAQEVYHDVGARVMGDADVIVPRERVVDALAVLAEAGWSPERTIDAATLTSLGGANLRDRQGRCLDLHWHVLPDNFDEALDRRIVAGAAPIEIGRARASCLQASDHLLEIICHGLSWAANTPIHWVADATTLLATHGESIDWNRFVELARLHRRTHCVQAGLRYLAAAFDAAVPDEVLRDLDAVRPDLPERLGFWFAERSHGGWPWGRVPLVAALYARSSRARGRRPGPLDFMRFVSARADCTPSQLLRRTVLNGWSHTGHAQRAGEVA